MGMKATTVRLSDPLMTSIQAAAAGDGVSVSQFLRESALFRLGYLEGRIDAAAEIAARPARADGPPDFESVSAAVLDYLHAQLGFTLWVVAEVDGRDWRIVQAHDRGYGVKRGDVFSWSGSYCYRMVQGKGPRIAPDAQSVPCYASAPIGKDLPIAAYVGAPLEHEDGSLYGTLCAIDPSPQPASIHEKQPLLESIAGLLSTTLAADAQTRRN